MPLNNVLILKNFIIPVHLGVTAAERKKSQNITLNIEIQFPQSPLACQTDKLADTICYHELTTAISEFCAKDKFNLIEYLGAELYKFIQSKIPANCKLRLSVAKQPPLKNVQEVVFRIEE
jgi:dihydroneopterin aldolase